MKAAYKKFNLQSLLMAFLPAALIFFGTISKISAHGGEDHGDEKPKTATTAKGTVLHTSRLGVYEVTLKHPVLEPDAATVARLFVTKFESNEPVENTNTSVEIESAAGAVTPAETEKTETPGSFLVKIPALQEGVYTIRAKLTYGGGTDTATFSGVDVAHTPQSEIVSAGWLGAILPFFAGAVVLGLFGVLFYFARRLEGEKGERESAVSA